MAYLGMFKVTDPRHSVSLEGTYSDSLVRLRNSFLTGSTWPGRVYPPLLRTVSYYKNLFPTQTETKIRRLNQKRRHLPYNDVTKKFLLHFPVTEL